MAFSFFLPCKDVIRSTLLESSLIRELSQTDSKIVDTVAATFASQYVHLRSLSDGVDNTLYRLGLNEGRSDEDFKR